MKTPHRFVCLTDQTSAVRELGITCLPLTTDWPGWWAKLEVFKRFTGQTLYLDLDNELLGSLDHLLVPPAEFWMVKDFYSPHLLNSSVMSWNGNYSRIPEAFHLDPELYQKIYRRTADGRIGDQAFIEDQIQDAKAFDHSSIVSYKRHCKNGAPAGASVVQFHGKPKASEVPGWDGIHRGEHL